MHDEPAIGLFSNVYAQAELPARNGTGCLAFPITFYRLCCCPKWRRNGKRRSFGTQLSFTGERAEDELTQKVHKDTGGSLAFIVATK
mmetsp:Transcript_26633/g.84753  ORF Transcript_26633/g.84753 Transcript_26633/m.84753 type:complete len:87 (+) Transcript_26633:896-1156(+)